MTSYLRTTDLSTRARRAALVFVAVLLVLSSSCSPSEAPPGQNFEEVTARTGINYTQFKGYNCFDPVICGPDFMAGGAAAGDYDGDGAVDLFITRIDQTPILYRNNGDGTFSDRTAESGIADEPRAMHTNGAAWADFENKGCPDLIVTAVHDRRNFLYVNDCKGHFTEAGVERGLSQLRSDDSVYGFGIAVGDYDRDGYLDVMTGEWRYDAIVPGAPSNARLFRSVGATKPGHFVDATEASGITISTSGGWLAGHFAFSPVFADIDRDGRQDIYIAADFNRGQLLWNNGDGTFTDGTKAARVDSDENGMGVAIGDIDSDGLPDIFVSSIYQDGSACGDEVLDHEFCSLWGMSGNRLYRNEGGRAFSDWTDAGGVRNGAWGWGSMMFDYENRGTLDIAQTAGQFWPYQGMGADRFHDDPTRLWRNNGSGHFEDVAHQAGIAPTGKGKGLLTFDFDNDGFLDVLVAENSGRARIFRNLAPSPQNGWLKVRPKGSVTNRDGVGAVVTLKQSADARAQYREVIGGSQFLGQSEKGLHFGLGPDPSNVAELTIDWPVSGCRQTLRNVPRNSTITPTESECLAGK